METTEDFSGTDLVWYRNYVRKSATPRLEPIRSKLRDMAAKERESQGEAAAANLEAPIEDVVGKISSREPDVIQAMRRTLRVLGKTLNTEKAYVQKVRAFMEDRGKGSRY